jgi:hypothetical protein
VALGIGFLGSYDVKKHEILEVISHRVRDVSTIGFDG